MNDSAAARRDSPWPEAVAVILAVVALLVSGYSLIAAQRQHEDERATELLDQIYEDWASLSDTDLWEVSHLAEVPATYEATRDRLRLYAAGLDDAEQLRLGLMERAQAIKIMTMFELAYRQYTQAVEAHDQGRVELLAQEIDFYVQDYLRNPRLLWFWAPDGGNLEAQADPPTIVFYREKVLNDPAHPLTQVADPDGILPSNGRS